MIVITTHFAKLASDRTEVLKLIDKIIRYGCRESIFVFWMHFFYISICFPPPLCSNIQKPKLKHLTFYLKVILSSFLLLKVILKVLFLCIWEIWQKNCKIQKEMTEYYWGSAFIQLVLRWMRTLSPSLRAMKWAGLPYGKA